MSSAIINQVSVDLKNNENLIVFRANGSSIKFNGMLAVYQESKDEDKKEVEDELCRTLGAEKVIWIPGDINETGTDGHIDGITAFIEPGRVLVEINSDKSDPHYQVCMENLNALKNIIS